VHTWDDGQEWQRQIDGAADFVLQRGPPGRYGALDAGLLGYRLDGARTVVNLDGLANDYRFAALVTRGAGLRERIAAEHVDVFVGRLPKHELDALRCGHVLYTSPRAVGFSDETTRYSVARVYVIDARGCS
jgi:hypothetical protein